MTITPHFIEINITELCNRECSFCPRAHGYPNLNLNMSVETAVRIKNQAMGFVDTIHIVGRGEPLLHPNFLNIVSIFAKDFKIRIMTNGDRLEQYIDELDNILDLNSGNHSVTISLYDDETQYNTLKNMFADYLDVRYYKTYDTGQGTDNPIFNQKHYITNRTGALYIAKNNAPCYIPLNRMFIDWDGTINLCCHDWTEKATYGNVYNETLQTIYKNITNKYSKQLVKGNRRCTKQCSTCDVSTDDPLQYVYSNWIEQQDKRIQSLGDCNV